MVLIFVLVGEIFMSNHSMKAAGRFVRVVLFNLQAV